METLTRPVVSGIPAKTEAAEYYFKYIDRIADADVVAVLERQLGEATAFLAPLAARAGHRYAEGKWTLAEALRHVTDTERTMTHRAFWFARGFEAPLPGFDQDVCAAAAREDGISWAEQVEELRAVRLASVTFFRALPESAWTKTGIASDNPFTVRSVAYCVAGHLDHHLAIVRERYL